MNSFVPQSLTSTNEFHHSTVAVNNTTPDQLISSALPHDEGDLSGLFTTQNRLNMPIPLGASSLFWLI
ncbi:MAG: hypothetical protein L3J75_08085 [Methylococcaceae bacterium]|nr:hypothetical protein [Methylococcaceae bacterium]